MLCTYEGDENCSSVNYRILFHPHLRVSLTVSDTASREQSFPPNPLVHEHEEVHATSRIVQVVRIFPAGSEYVQVPLPEHTVPVEKTRNQAKKEVDEDRSREI